jgi:hypothetical protein
VCQHRASAAVVPVTAGRDLDRALAGLRHHWGSAYLIVHPGPDTWIAWRRDDQARLHAEDPEALREQIRADYAARPVPRRGEADG